MANRFRWVLTCEDDQTTYELGEEPIGWDAASYRLERHHQYKGIFNQFVDNIKFHNDNGGKAFVDSKYELFDINCSMLIDVYIDSTGLGDYEILFSGRLNMANYTTDALYTTTNIEQSELYTKMNTRADVPVPLNVINVNLPGQPTFHGVLVDTYIPADHGGVTTGSYQFYSPDILSGKTFYVITHDGGNVAVYDSLTFTADNLQGPGGSSGGTTIQITDISEGYITVDFVSINGNIELYDASAQLSLGQKAIQAVPVISLPIPGVPIKYDSLFKMKGTVNSGTLSFNDARVVAGHRYYAYASDGMGNDISDWVLFTGANISGGGVSSNYASIRIFFDGTANTVKVEYNNVDGAVEVWIDDITELTPQTPTSTGSVQLFDETPIFDGSTYDFKGFMTFDVDTIFDNYGKYSFEKESNFEQHGPTLFYDDIGPILDENSEDNYLSYPMDIEYDISFDGSLDEWTTGGPTRSVTVSIAMLWGNTPQQASDDGNIITIWSGSVAASPNAHNIFTLTGASSGTMTLLDRKKKVWLQCYITEQLTSGVSIGQTQQFLFEFTFTASSFSFKTITKSPATTAPVLLAHEALNQAVDMIADSDGNLYSEFYGRTDSEKRTYGSDGEGSLRAITNGLCIRGHQDRFISTSFNDLFTSLQAIDNIGLEIDSSNRVRIEQLSHFFDKNTKILTLPLVRTYEQVNANEYYYNQIEVGYDKWDTEIYYRNGLDEIHAKRFHGTKVGTAKGQILPKYGSTIKSMVGASNKLDLISGFVAGNYAIELTRRKNSVWSNDDFKYDQDRFIIEVCREVNVTGGAFEQTGGVNYIYTDFGTAYPRIGSTFDVTGTASNDGTYTVVSFINQAGFSNPIITVAEAVTLEGPVDFVLTPSEGFLVQTSNQVLESDITNVMDSTLSRAWMNIGITPARMLQSNMNLIFACLQKINGNVQFLNGEGNYRAITEMLSTLPATQNDYTKEPLGENSSIAWNDVYVRNSIPLWVPDVYKFEYPLTYQEFKDMKANPNGYVEFWQFAGEVKKGFIISADYNLKTGLTKFELLKMYE